MIKCLYAAFIQIAYVLEQPSYMLLNALSLFYSNSLKTELGKMQHALGAVDGTDPTSFKLCSRGEFDDIVKEKERLAEEVLQLKKV